MRSWLDTVKHQGTPSLQFKHNSCCRSYLRECISPLTFEVFNKKKKHKNSPSALTLPLKSAVLCWLTAASLASSCNCFSSQQHINFAQLQVTGCSQTKHRTGICLPYTKSADKWMGMIFTSISLSRERGEQSQNEWMCYSIKLHFQA